MRLSLTKYQGLGNDFLVLVDWTREIALDAALVAAICDRHRGLGADGLLRLSAPARGGSLYMELRNADGGVAETSGNGLRCAALAAVHEGLVAATEIVVETLAGASRAWVATGAEPGGGQVRVEMGAARLGPEVPALGLALGPGSGEPEREELERLGDRIARHVEIGNPHIVILGRDAVPDGAQFELGRLGPALETGVSGGVNVEVVSPLSSPDALRLDVWERGAGITLACGSGSCAAAAAARASAVVGDVVRVLNPGGELLVELSGALLNPRVVLSGPARRVAKASLDTSELLAAPAAAAVRERQLADPAVPAPSTAPSAAGGLLAAHGRP